MILLIEIPRTFGPCALFPEPCPNSSIPAKYRLTRQISCAHYLQLKFFGGSLMFEITPKAEEMMLAFFKERNETALVRIFLNEGG